MASSSQCGVSGEGAGRRAVMEAAAAGTGDIMEGIRSGDMRRRIEAAREIRRLTKTSTRQRRRFSVAIDSLVEMLLQGGTDCGEAAMLALLNLAVKDERNKIKIVHSGALAPLMGYLQSSDSTLQEYAAASILTLTASPMNKQAISDVGVIPFLVRILWFGNQQAKIDAAMALYNLSTIPDNLIAIASLHPTPALVNLLKTCKKSSKTVEKCCALLESLLSFDGDDDARTSLAAEEGGVLAMVEAVEEGSPQSREHAVGALLAMCESDRLKYREALLNEGVIPGLLELTVQGTPKAQSKARVLLQLLRDSPQPEPHADAREDTARADEAKRVLAEMVQVSMEQSLRHLQRRAFVHPPSGELAIGSCPSSEVSSK